MRHEQASAYAADGWARTTGTPGVCCVTAGCGLTNAVTGLCVAGLTNSAVVCIAGQHPSAKTAWARFRKPTAPRSAARSASSRTACSIGRRISFDVRQAFREAMAPPQGVSVLEIPTNILYHQDEETDQRRGAKVYEPDQLRSQGDPARSSAPIELLAPERAAAVVGGDGIFWSGAAAELAELAELTRTPVYARRAGQGALSEDNPLAVRGAWKKPFTGRADLVIAIGFRFWSGEKFGQPPTWTDKATYVQVDATPTRIGWQVPAEVAIVGDPKLVLRQLIDAAKARHDDFAPTRTRPGSAKSPRRAPTFARRSPSASGQDARRSADPSRPPDRRPGEVLDKDATMVIDSFTLSGYISHWYRARFPGRSSTPGRSRRWGTASAWRSARSWRDRANRWSRSSATAAWASAAGTWRRPLGTTFRSWPCCGTTAPGDPASSRCRCSRVAPIRST